MDNLHRELAPVSSAAWSQIEEEVARTFRRLVAGRRVVDVEEPGGIALAAVGTGRQRSITAPRETVRTQLREVKALVELTAPFTLRRDAVDAVERGANDSDWQPAKDAARELAFTEDQAIFDGYGAAGIVGIREGSSNGQVALPDDVDDYPAAVGHALEQLRLAGVDGPYAVVLGADAYTTLFQGNNDGYPIVEHVKHIVNGDLVWAPAIAGGCVLSTRGGDFELRLGQDLSIGYFGHTEDSVHLYLRETLTFLMLTSEASVTIRG
ncbi:MAG: bacteriocin [Candidimonas sp.]|nr:MAG: bacteriocin [Candidimonas sp.]